MCKDPAGPRTLVQRANGGADRRRLSPRASSPPTTSFGLLQHAAEVALVVDGAPDEESASATTFTLSHLDGALADVR